MSTGSSFQHGFLSCGKHNRPPIRSHIGKWRSTSHQKLVCNVTPWCSNSLQTVRTFKVSNPQDWILNCSYHCVIWQAARQQCCRDACQIPFFKLPIALSRLRDFVSSYDPNSNALACQWPPTYKVGLLWQMGRPDIRLYTSIQTNVVTRYKYKDQDNGYIATIKDQHNRGFLGLDVRLFFLRVAFLHVSFSRFRYVILLPSCSVNENSGEKVFSKMMSWYVNVLLVTHPLLGKFPSKKASSVDHGCFIITWTH